MVARKYDRHGGRGTRLYQIWADMKCRCANVKIKCYKNYGGRGISVCSEWAEGFAAFRTWALSSGYEEHLTLDRINVNGNYEPSNCRWATYSQQLANRRKPLTGASSKYKGVHWNKSDGVWVAQLGFSGRTIHIGSFANEIDAAKAYDAAAIKYFGEYANPNFKEEAANELP